jgi:hypothetical protein
MSGVLNVSLISYCPVEVALEYVCDHPVFQVAPLSDDVAKPMVLLNWSLFR